MSELSYNKLSATLTYKEKDKNYFEQDNTYWSLLGDKPKYFPHWWHALWNLWNYSKPKRKPRNPKEQYKNLEHYKVTPSNSMETPINMTEKNNK